MNNKIFSLLMAGLFLSMAVFAQQSDAVFNKIEKYYTLHPDGRMQYREVKDLTLNTHYAFNRSYGETFIVFNPETQKLLIDEAYTMMADGKKVVAPENAFNPVLPRQAADFPHAAHLREMVVTHTALEVGATVHLDYTINTEAGFFPALMEKIVIPQNDPVNEMKIIVRVPDETPFNYHITKLRTGPEITKESGFTIYTFTFMAVKPHAHDYWQKAEHTGEPVLTFSTSKDLHRIVDNYVAQNAFQMKASAEMIKAVEQVTKDAEKEMDKILAIQNLVVNEVHHFGIDEKNLGYDLRYPSMVWSSNGGTDAENALLLATLLRAGGINASPMALFAPGTPDKKAGNLNEIVGYLVQVKPKTGKPFYLSAKEANSYDAALDYPGYNAMLLDAAVESLRFETFPGPDTKLVMDADITFGSEKSNVAGTVKMMGMGVPVFHNSDTAEHIRRIKSLPVKVKDITVFDVSSSAANMTFGMETDNPVEARGGYYILSLPYLAGDPVKSWPSELPSERMSDIDLGNGLDISYSYDIALPEGYGFVIPEEPLVIKNDIGSVEVSFILDGKVLSVKRSFRIPDPEVGQQNWKEVKALFDSWRTEKYNTLIIKAL